MSRKPPEVPRICKNCSKEFFVYAWSLEHRPGKYCSLSCGIAFRNKKAKISPQEIFFKNISHEDDPNGCWIYLRGNRYGKIKVDGVTSSAHRYSYELHYGEIPSGLHICHYCDVMKCVNPKHLFLGTPKDNQQDCIKKGRKITQKGDNHWTRRRPN